MIDEIHLGNFQSHKDTTLALDPGLNVIVGASDSGKSAIIRALRWLIWNRPMGDAFINHNAQGAFVNITTDEMDVIQRAKGPGGNEYRINDQFFKAFGNDVPEEIQAILNMDEVNLQQQLDRPFLISNSPGEVAAYFNKIVRLDKIDAGTKKINSQIRTLTNQISADESRKEQFEIELGEYKYLDHFEVDLEELEKMNRDSQNITRAIDNITSALAIIDTDAKYMEDLKMRLDFLTPVDEILDLHQKRDELASEKYILKNQKESIQRIESEINQASLELSAMEEYYHKEMQGTCPLCGSEITTKN
jgi:exonuclease SbcC